MGISFLLIFHNNLVKIVLSVFLVNIYSVFFSVYLQIPLCRSAEVLILPMILLGAGFGGFIIDADYKVTTAVPKYADDDDQLTTTCILG